MIARLPDATLAAEMDEARRQLAAQSDPRTATAEVRALHLVSVLEELQERRMPLAQRAQAWARSATCADCGHRMADHGSVGCRFVAGPYRACKCETAVGT
jgi:acyl-CoA reductase-like NAD-dependent aldehyde dehydrogenase